LLLAPAAHAADDLTTSRLAEAVNVLRAQNGLPALTVQAQLNQAAQSHADYLAMTNTFTHSGAGGSTHLNRIRATGYPMCAGTENIASGAWEPDTIVRLWASSSGHRANMLGSQYTELGVGRSQSRAGEVYWVLVEGKPCGPGETPPTFITIGGMSMPLVSSLPDGRGGLGGGGYSGYPSAGLGGYGTGAYGPGGYRPLGNGLGGYGPVGSAGGAYFPWDAYGGPGWAWTGYGGWGRGWPSGWGSPGYGGYAPDWGPSFSAWGAPR
jgi:hypothetical protein